MVEVPTLRSRSAPTMLPGESNLEIRTCLPTRANGNRANGNRVGEKPPLLFVHGGYCDAWCWAPYYLPWFAAKGYAAHALSLRGHGASAGRETMFVTGLDDFAADVLAVAAGLPSPPVLIGHSMGAAVIERLLVSHPVRAAALIAPVPPTGVLPMAARLATEQPDQLMQLLQFDPARLTAHVLDVLRPFYFSPDVAPEILIEATKHLSTESPRALLDLSLRLHWQLPQRNDVPLFVLGAEGDRVSRAEDVRATATHHGVEATIVPGLAHMLMLERQWERGARELARWLATI
jgi:pimeloyl-ACP methyl ester carboxylesterase